MTRKISQICFIYSPIGRTGSTALTAWIGASPSVGRNAQERTYFVGKMLSALAQMNVLDQDYFLRREPIEKFFQNAIEAYRVDAKKALVVKLHDLGTLQLVKRIWPEAAIVYSARNRDEQFRSKAEQAKAVSNVELSREAFDAAADLEDVEIAGVSHFRIEYENLPKSMPALFDYLGFISVDAPKRKLIGAHAARTFKAEPAQFDEMGWRKSVE